MARASYCNPSAAQLTAASVLFITLTASISPSWAASPPPSRPDPAANGVSSSTTSAEPNQETTENDGDEADEPLDPNRLEHAILPAVAGSSDIGFLFGAMGTLAQFAPGYTPYRWRGESVLVTAVKDGPDGAELTMQVYYLRLNFPELLGGRLRLTPEVFFTRRINAGYYGLGNASRPGLSPGQPEGPESGRVNQYVASSPMAQVNAQIGLGHGFEAVVGSLLRTTFIAPYPGSKLELDARALDETGDPLIHGVDPQGSGHVRLAAGGQFDSRDHETAPQRGMFHSLGVYGSPPGPLGNEDWFGAMTADARFFIPLLRDHLVLGLRVLGDLRFGQSPFGQLGQYGVFKDQSFTGSRGLRGPPQGRYHGQVKVMGNVELRAMFLSFMLFDQRWRFGATGLWDTGRVWAGYRVDPVLDGTGLGLKFGVGGGPRLQIGETVMIRVDVVYSPDSADGYGDLPVGIYWDMSELF